jgi:hypothetical protein
MGNTTKSGAEGTVSDVVKVSGGEELVVKKMVILGGVLSAGILLM